MTSDDRRSLYCVNGNCNYDVHFESLTTPIRGYINRIGEEESDQKKISLLKIQLDKSIEDLRDKNLEIHILEKELTEEREKNKPTEIGEYIIDMGTENEERLSMSDWSATHTPKGIILKKK